MSNWGTWTDLAVEYRESKEKILNHKDKLKKIPANKKTAEQKAEKELTASMGSDLTQLHREIQKKCLYAYNALSQEDLEKIKLTKRQRNILELRLQEKTFSEIAEQVKGDLKDVFEAYQKAIREIERYKKMSGLEYNLTPQQNRIYELKKQGYKNKEIARLLNINANIVKSQLYQIKKVNKIPQNKLGVKVCPKSEKTI